ncbi:MAG: trehalose-6-phosphate synthase, partial [Methyloligellaceae bacterium]
MSRLVVISNRIADLTKSSQSGGLAVALVDALKATGGLWFGWGGDIVGDGTKIETNIQTIDTVTVASVPLTEEDYDQYYLGFSNKELWPVFHYRLDLAEFDTDYVNGYRRVNQMFADKLCPLLKPDDLIWIHDYHLIPLAAELRQRNVGQTIGFFLHIPFPPPEILSATPEHEWLVRS